MKKVMITFTIGLLIASGSASAQDRRHHNHGNPGNHHSRSYHHQPHSHSHRTPSYLGPAIIGGAILGYGLYNAPRYYDPPPPPTYYEPVPALPYAYEEKIWDAYCGCYRVYPR